MRRVWAVARQTFAECIRMKIALAFIVLLATALVVIPLTLRGDGTLAGRIRTFLSYGVSLTGGLLSIVTVLVTVAVVSEDIRLRTIELLAVKPLKRWQYLLGRWLGVVLLAGLLLAIGATSIYLLAEHYREQPASSPLDRSAVEKEVFTARVEVKPLPPDFQAEARKRVEAIRRDEPARYESILQDFQQRQDLSPDEALQAMLNETLKQVVSEYETVGPYRRLVWRFEDVALRGEPMRQESTVVRNDTPRGDPKRYLRLTASRNLLGKLVYNGPVRVLDKPGRVAGKGRDDLIVSFAEDLADDPALAGLAKGDTVTVLAEPTLQFHYKVKPIGSPGGRETLYRQLQFLKPDGQRVYAILGETPINTPVTVTLPATGVLEDGRLMVEYTNLPQPNVPAMSVQVPAKDVSLRYSVGGFGMNFLRSALLMFFQLAFLAALGVFFGSFLSFPVASLCCLALLGAGWLTNWLAESMSWAKLDRGEFDPITLLGLLVLETVRILLPSLQQTSPSDRLVDGLLVPWRTVGSAAIWALLVRGGFYLAAGCLIFHRRELSKVQV